MLIIRQKETGLVCPLNLFRLIPGHEHKFGTKDSLGYNFKIPHSPHCGLSVILKINSDYSL
jgi:hypothetical protein